MKEIEAIMLDREACKYTFTEHAMIKIIHLFSWCFKNRNICRKQKKRRNEWKRALKRQEAEIDILNLIQTSRVGRFMATVTLS